MPLDPRIATLHPMRRDVENLIEVERRLLGVEDRPRPSRQTGTRARKATPLPPLRRIPARIDAILKRKGQVILYGPPGTGKTYWALRTARELVARSWRRRSWGDLEPAERRELSERGALQTCCFHPAYGYEEFPEGFRPRAEAGAMECCRCCPRFFAHRPEGDLRGQLVPTGLLALRSRGSS